MSSDESYANFLDQANQSTSKASTQSKSNEAQTKTVDDGAQAPASLRQLDVTYTSEADEPFEPVFLNTKGDGKISKDAFLQAIGHDGSVDEISIKDFDPRGDYKKVVDAVKAEGKGDVQVFKVEAGGARVQYYIFVPDGSGHIVGFRAKAVES